jgi:hypothetical protein
MSTSVVEQIKAKVVELNVDHGFCLTLDLGMCSENHEVLILKCYPHQGNGIVIMHDYEPNVQAVLDFLSPEVIELLLEEGLFDSFNDIFLKERDGEIEIEVYVQTPSTHSGTIVSQESNEILSERYSNMSDVEFEIELSKLDDEQKVFARHLRMIGRYRLN